MTNFCTHVIQNFESKAKSVLSRKADGMVIAVRVGNTVAWGEDPRQQQQRVFTDPVFAQACLRKIADADWDVTNAPEAGTSDEMNDRSQGVRIGQTVELKARIEEIEGESRLVSPSVFSKVGLQ